MALSRFRSLRRRRRRRFAGRAALLLALLAIMTLASAAADEIPPGTIVMAKRIDGVQSLDPAAAYETAGLEVVGNLYEPLADLVSSWEADPAGRRFTFHLRRGARFASGRPVTAQDAAFSLERVLRLSRTPALILAQFDLTATATDDERLVIATPRPVAPSLLYNCLAAPVAAIVERREALAHEVDGDLGEGWLARHSAGSGPYRLGVWRPGERIVLEAVPGYWGGRPQNDRVILRNIKEAGTQRLLLEHGDADYARDLDTDQLAALAANPAIGFDRGRTLTLTYLAVNQADAALARPGLVAALRRLIDYGGIARHVLDGTAHVHQSFLPAGLLGAVDENPFALDIGRARDLLGGAEVSLTLDVPNDAALLEIAQALQAGFARAGVHLAIAVGDDKAILTKYRARRHQLFLGGWTPDYPDPHSNAQAFAIDDAGLKTLAWRNSWDDAAAARLAAAAASERDPDRRAALYRDLDRALQERSPFIFLFQQIEVAAHGRLVDGLVIGATADRTRYAGIARREGEK
jgi:peptide/nickel transport system substrate-binding protein